MAEFRVFVEACREAGWGPAPAPGPVQRTAHLAVTGSAVTLCCEPLSHFAETSGLDADLTWCRVCRLTADT